MARTPKVWNGEEWVTATPKQWNGSEWEPAVLREKQTVGWDPDAGPLPGIIRFAKETSVATTGQMQIAVRRLAGDSGTVTVEWSTDEDTPRQGVLEWAPGDNGDKLIVLDVVKYLISLAGRDITITLSNPTGGATIGSIPEHVAVVRSLAPEGAYFDLAQEGTVFQDVAGTTPANVGDPVRLIKDVNGLGYEAVHDDVEPEFVTKLAHDGAQYYLDRVPYEQDELGQYGKIRFIPPSPGGYLAVSTAEGVQISHRQDFNGQDMLFPVACAEVLAAVGDVTEVQRSALLTVLDRANKGKKFLVGKTTNPIVYLRILTTSGLQHTVTFVGANGVQYNTPVPTTRTPIDLEAQGLTMPATVILDESVAEDGGIWHIDFYTSDVNALLPDISRFPGMTDFRCRSNGFVGTLPDFGYTPNITRLDVGVNRLSGHVDLSPLRNLDYVNLSYNEFTGPLPDLANHPNITSFHCRENHFTGGFPAIEKALNLQQLDISHNNLGGELTDYQISKLASHPKLLYLWMGYNNFEGEPGESFYIGYPQTLQYFYAQHNNFTGRFTHDIQWLRRLVIYNNDFWGRLPPVTNMFGSENQVLEIYDVSFNRFDGFIYNLQYANKLTFYNVSYNQLTGYNSTAISPTLTQFYAMHNQLPQSAIDQILQHLDQAGAVNGFCSLEGGGNEPPSGVGLAAKANLEAKGWQVFVTEE